VPFTCFRFQVLDADVLGSIEASPWPASGILRLAAPWTEARTIYRDGRVAFLLLEPTDAVDDALDLPLALYQAIVDSEGDDAGPDSTDLWLAEGEAWARAALVRMPSGVFERWQGCRAARLAQVRDRLLRGYLMPPGVVERITGVPITEVRGLFPIGHDANRLAEAARAAADALATAKAAAETIRIEAARPRSLAELGIEMVAARKDRTDTATTLEPFPISPVGETEEEVLYAWKSIPAMELPAFSINGVRSLAAAEFPPAPMGPVLEASPHVLGFLTRIRARFGVGLDFGPVDDSLWTDRHVTRARELARQHAGLFLAHPTPHTAWRSGWLVELLVRGLLVRPDIAAELLLAELDGLFSRRRPPLRVPTDMHIREARFAAAESTYARQETGYTPSAQFTSGDLPSRTDRAVVGALAANAAARGIISVGALLEPLPAKRNGRKS